MAPYRGHGPRCATRGEAKLRTATVEGLGHILADGDTVELAIR